MVNKSIIITAIILIPVAGFFFYRSLPIGFFKSDNEIDSLVQKHLMNADTLMKNQNENKAIQEYLYVLEIKPNRDAYLRLGNYYARKTEIAYNKGNYTQAEQKFDSSQYYLITGLNYWPDNSELNYNLGILYFLRNDRYEDSELRFNNVLKSTPGHRKTIETLVELYSRQRRFDKAKNLLQNGIEYHPGYARFYTELGIVYSKQGLYDEAIWNLEKAMELNYDLKAKYYLQSINAGLKKKNLKK